MVLDPGYLGCFKDSDIDYTTRVAIGARNLTTKSCLDQCHEPFWTPRPQYAGPMGELCVCFSAQYFSSSDTRPNAHDDSDCNVPCEGDVNDACGGRGPTGEIELIPVYDCTSLETLKVLGKTDESLFASKSLPSRSKENLSTVFFDSTRLI